MTPARSAQNKPSLDQFDLNMTYVFLHLCAIMRMCYVNQYTVVRDPIKDVDIRSSPRDLSNRHRTTAPWTNGRVNQLTLGPEGLTEVGSIPAGVDFYTPEAISIQLRVDFYTPEPISIPLSQFLYLSESISIPLSQFLYP